MTSDAPRNVVHLLVADLSRTACRVPATPAMSTTTIADNATCKECLLNSGRN
jgi:hypothetical protein